MTRAYYINGESMVSVKGNSNSAIASIQQLGLSDGPIQVTFSFKHKDIQVDAWGGVVPPEVQVMLAEARISMTLVHFDNDILESCFRESLGGAASYGALARAGTLMGGNAARFAPTNHYIGLNILSPVEGQPYRFLYAYLAEQPLVFPLGTEKSLVQLNWRSIPWTIDPWNNGNGAAGTLLFDNTLDT